MAWGSVENFCCVGISRRWMWRGGKREERERERERGKGKWNGNGRQKAIGEREMELYSLIHSFTFLTVDDFNHIIAFLWNHSFYCTRVLYETKRMGFFFPHFLFFLPSFLPSFLAPRKNERRKERKKEWYRDYKFITRERELIDRTS